jgi:hypothetical protein
MRADLGNRHKSMPPHSERIGVRVDTGMPHPRQTLRLAMAQESHVHFCKRHAAPDLAWALMSFLSMKLGDGGRFLARPALAVMPDPSNRT